MNIRAEAGYGARRAESPAGRPPALARFTVARTRKNRPQAPPRRGLLVNFRRSAAFPLADRRRRGVCGLAAGWAHCWSSSVTAAQPRPGLFGPSHGQGGQGLGRSCSGAGHHPLGGVIAIVAGIPLGPNPSRPGPGPVWPHVRESARGGGRSGGGRPWLHSWRISRPAPCFRPPTRSPLVPSDGRKGAARSRPVSCFRTEPSETPGRDAHWIFRWAGFRRRLQAHCGVKHGADARLLAGRNLLFIPERSTGGVDRAAGFAYNGGLDRGRRLGSRAVGEAGAGRGVVGPGLAGPSIADRRSQPGGPGWPAGTLAGRWTGI